MKILQKKSSGTTKISTLRNAKFFQKTFSKAAAGTILAISLSAFSFSGTAFGEVLFPAETQPGTAFARGNDVLGNDKISAKFSKNGFVVKSDGKTLAKGDELFSLQLGNGEILSSKDFAGTIKKAVFKPDPSALTLSKKLGGNALEAKFSKGDLEISWRAILRNGSHYIRQELKISAEKDVPMTAIFPLKFSVPEANSAKIVGNTRGSPLISENFFAALETPMGINEFSEKNFSGTWSRKTVLKKGETWEVSSVIGILVPEQKRRAFLAYVERERVVPWRPFVHYNSWYELNINRNDFSDPKKRMNEKQCLEVVDSWNKNLFQKYKVGIDAFVWDDGWDEFNSLWQFHVGFPNGFKKIDLAARKQNAGTGAWLGPVGGYGASKAQRIANWNSTHANKISNFQLSNSEYFDAFVGRCSQMISDYDMRYFKFDGISTHFHAKGPGNEEDAEGIIKVEKTLRKKRKDIFFNTTVGTWASPFWFFVADSIWRQEQDHGMIGEGDARERWITYRDRLVHEVFVSGAPFCPINSLMTHGLMVTKFGPPAQMPRERAGILKEMRCAFASGSALQELYVDSDLMTQLNLWKDLAECIKWFRGNADVLDDVHWVGGNPWNKAENAGTIYGWAAWNSKKSTLALRNSSAKEQILTGTLRKFLDVPAFVKGAITLKNSFSDQRNLPGISGTTIPLDKEISFKLAPFEVFVFDGKPAK